MANSSVSFTKSTQTDNDLMENQIYENTSVRNSPAYDVLYPISQKYVRIPVKVDQPQSESRCNISSTSTVINSHSRNEIKSYVVWSIINILCCCLPLGCCACYYSSMVDDALQMGDIQGAWKASKKARSINFIATCTGMLMFLIIVIACIQQVHELVQKSRQANKYSFH